MDLKEFIKIKKCPRCKSEAISGNIYFGQILWFNNNNHNKLNKSIGIKYNWEIECWSCDYSGEGHEKKYYAEPITLKGN